MFNSNPLLPAICLFGLCFFGATTIEAQDLVLVPRLGIVLGGNGSLDTECSSGTGSFGLQCPDANQDTNDVSALALGLDLLVDVGGGLSLGGGILAQSENTIEPTPLGIISKPSSEAGATEPDRIPIPLTVSGGDISLFGLLEYAIELSPRSRLIGRAQAGVFTLILSEELEDNVSESTVTGWSAGGGVGTALDVQGIGLRGDLMLQYFELPTIEYTLSNPDMGNATLNGAFDYASFRVMLMLGFEFGRG